MIDSEGKVQFVFKKRLVGANSVVLSTEPMVYVRIDYEPSRVRRLASASRELAVGLALGVGLFLCIALWAVSIAVLAGNVVRMMGLGQ